MPGVAEGLFASLDEATESLVEFGATYEPESGKRAAYDEAYGLYRAVYAALEPVFDRRKNCTVMTVRRGSPAPTPPI